MLPLHRTSESTPCWRANSQPPVLRNQTLAAKEVTDVLLLDFSRCLGNRRGDLALVTTLGYGLHRAAARMLQLDGRELGVATTPAGELGRGLGALLYDNVPGGAGHVRELLEIGTDLLELTKQVLYVDEAHNQRCKSACLDCLLSFETQEAMREGHLNRPLALSVLSDLLNGKDPVVLSAASPGNAQENETGDPQPGPKPTIEARQGRARENRARNAHTPR